MKPVYLKFLPMLVALLTGAILLTSCKGDKDLDRIPDEVDNCPEVANTDQADSDGDHIGNACDPDFKSASPPQEEPAPAAENSPDVLSPPTECPTGNYWASRMPGGKAAIWNAVNGFPAAQTSESSLTDASGNPIPGKFAQDGKNAPLLFEPESDAVFPSISNLSFKYRYGYLKAEHPCEYDIKLYPNPANLTSYVLDEVGDVFQHLDRTKPAGNAAYYDDILATIPWYDGFPLTPETSPLIAAGLDQYNEAPNLFQIFGDINLKYKLDGVPFPGWDGMPLPSAQVDLFNASNKRFSVYVQDSFSITDKLSLNVGVRHDVEEGSLPETAPAVNQGFQLSSLGQWNAKPLAVAGNNFTANFAGAWSGAAFNSARNENGVWAAGGSVEITGNGKTVMLQGPGDGKNVALSVVAADGTPSDAQTVTPAELGQQFGAYTAAMPKTLTFEIFLAGPFASNEISQEMMDGLAWQVLLDLDGDANTGAKADFAAAQGLGFELFFHSEGKTVVCSGTTSTGGAFDCPKGLFTVTYDPAGRVVMSAPLAELQAIAAQAGVAFDPAKMDWRVSHINHLAEGNPQDIFPNP